MQNFLKIIFLVLLFSFQSVPQILAADKFIQKVKIGFFEGGNSPTHALLRSEYKRVLKQILPEEYKIQYTPNGFKTALWNRDTCRTMAMELSNSNDVDIIVCFGPWVVEELIEAGCKKPIIAIHRIHPIEEKLINQNNQPIVENLTFQFKPNKIQDDILAFYDIYQFKKLGVLLFPTGDERNNIIKEIEIIGEKVGFEVYSAEGNNNVGTFAFFKSFNELNKKEIDALYLFPLWGLDVVQLGEFLKLVNSQQIPSFTYEGNNPVQRGAMASNGTLSFITDAKFNAYKTVQIIRGKSPSELETIFPERSVLVINEKTATTCNIELDRKFYYNSDILTPPPSEEINPISLIDAVSLALAQNPGYLAKYDALEAANHAARQASTDFYPKIDLGLSAFHIDDNSVNNSHNWYDNNGYDATITYDQQLFSLESIKKAKAIAFEKDLTELDLNQAKLDLELATTKAYLDYLKTQEIYALTKQNREHINLYYEIARLNSVLNNADTADIFRWDNEWYNASADVIDSRFNFLKAQLVFRTLLNLPPEYEITLDTSLFTTENMLGEYRQIYNYTGTKTEQIFLQDYLYKIASSLHPEKQSMNVRINLVSTLLEKNKARYYPKAGVRTSFTYADRLNDDFPGIEEKHNSWSILGYLKLPLFSGFDRSREKAKLKAKLSETEYLRDAKSLEIMNAIFNNFYDMLSNSDQMPSAHRSHKKSRIVLQIAVENYESEIISYIELLDAQKNAYKSDNRMINYRYNYFNSLANLVNVIGLSMSDRLMGFNQLFIEQLENYNSEN